MSRRNLIHSLIILFPGKLIEANREILAHPPLEKPHERKFRRQDEETQLVVNSPPTI